MSRANPTLWSDEIRTDLSLSLATLKACQRYVHERHETFGGVKTFEVLQQLASHLEHVAARGRRCLDADERCVLRLVASRIRVAADDANADAEGRLFRAALFLDAILREETARRPACPPNE